MTGHSTLNANQLGLPRGSGDLIDAAVEKTNITAPQPVGAFSSSIAVKPTSGNSTDLNKIIGKSIPTLSPSLMIVCCMSLASRLRSRLTARKSYKHCQKLPRGRQSKVITGCGIHTISFVSIAWLQAIVVRNGIQSKMHCID